MKRLNRGLLEEKVSCRIRNDIETHHILGASVLVRQEGEVLLNAHYGFADLARQKPLDGDCIFRIASMSKVVSAVAAMIAVERGQISPDDTVEKYLPAFSALRRGILNEKGEAEVLGPLKEPIRIRHLLTHTSLIDYGPLYAAQRAKMRPEQDATLASALDFYSRLVMELEPGVRNSYSGTVAFDLLAGVLEQVSGLSIGDYIRKEITEPLQMKDTTFTPSPEQRSRMVEMHDKKDGVSVKGVTHEGCVFERTPVTHPLAGAGLVSTVRDYDRFAQMLVNGGELEGVRLLSAESVKRMGSPWIPQLEGSSNRWGFGVRVIDNEKKILPIGCFGWSGAYGTHFWVDPENKITAVYMKNSQHDGGGGAQTSCNMERDVVASME